MENRSALVAYATETGNAYDYAEELQRTLQRIHFETRLSQLDGVDTKTLTKYTIVIFVVSTTGQGDIPINGRQFWRKLLRKKLPPTCLADVQFSIFGLGDSSYPKFNWAARKFYRRLSQLGANELYPPGEADEQHEDGLDASFVPWSSDLRKYLLRKYPLPTGVEPILESDFLVPEWRLSLQSDQHKGTYKTIMNGDSSSAPLEGDPPFRSVPSHINLTNGDLSTATPQSLVVKLEGNHRMTPGNHWQDVRHLTLTSESVVDYAPGDILTIFPKNTQDDVDQLLARMEWVNVADQPIHFTRSKADEKDSLRPLAPIALQRSTTLRLLLTEYLDITAIPRRSFFTTIAHFTDDQFHKDRLLEFTKPEYLDELYDYTTRPRRSILEVLQEFESVKIPWQWALGVLPQLRGRQFSIASGGTTKRTSTGATQFELLVAIVKYKTVIKKIREGVCTRYLAALPIGTKLRVTVQKGGLAVSKKEAWRPVVMIGPGTGVAPMRSLIWERRMWLREFRTKAVSHEHHPLGDSKLFFGCRNKAADYFYHEEWEDLEDQMRLEVHAAFSRDQSEKSYVQDVLRQQSKSVYRLLHEAGGLVYVCGSSGKMPQAVRAALVDVFREHGKLDQAAADKYLEDMEKEGRYKQETW